MNIEFAASKNSTRAGKYLSFVLAQEVYAVEIMCVREIVALIPITPVPRTPAFIKGVINLRGKIIPVVDLRTKFEMPHEDYTRETCIIIVEVTASLGPIYIGIIVDSMREVFSVTQSEIDEVPAFGVSVDTSFLTGLARGKSGIKLLLNIERVLSQEELVATETVKEEMEGANPAALTTDKARDHGATHVPNKGR